MLSGNGDDTLIGFNLAGLRIREHRPTLNDAHLRAIEQAANAPVQPVDDAVLPFDGAREIETRRRIERDAERVAAHRLGDLGVAIGGMDQRLRRDAAANEARAAEPVLLDEHRIEAELTRADRRDIATHAAANDEHARTQGFGHYSAPLMFAEIGPPEIASLRSQ